MVLATIVEIAGTIMTRRGHNNVMLYNLYWLVEFVLLVYIARSIIAKPPVWSAIAIPAFLLLWASEFVLVWGRYQLVIYSVMVGAFLLVGIYLALLWELVNTWVGPLHRSTTFWLCLAVLLYFGGAAPVLGSVNYFIGTDARLAQQLFWVVRGLCVLKFLLMAVMFSRMTAPTQPTTAP